MPDITRDAKNIIALEIVENSAKAFFAYLATLEGFTINGRAVTLSDAYKSFAADVWVQVIEDLAAEREKTRGR